MNSNNSSSSGSSSSSVPPISVNDQRLMVNTDKYSCNAIKKNAIILNTIKKNIIKIVWIGCSSRSSIIKSKRREMHSSVFKKIALF